MISPEELDSRYGTKSAKSKEELLRACVLELLTDYDGNDCEHLLTDREAHILKNYQLTAFDFYQMLAKNRRIIHDSIEYHYCTNCSVVDKEE